jgi:hypothetical protein
MEKRYLSDLSRVREFVANIPYDAELKSSELHTSDDGMTECSFTFIHDSRLYALHSSFKKEQEFRYCSVLAIIIGIIILLGSPLSVIVINGMDYYPFASDVMRIMFLITGLVMISIGLLAYMISRSTYRKCKRTLDEYIQNKY